MYYYNGNCLESCPFLTSKDIRTHVCEYLGPGGAQYLPFIIPVVALLTTFGALLISRQKSADAHEPLGIAIAFLT